MWHPAQPHRKRWTKKKLWKKEKRNTNTDREKSRKLIGKILFMADSICERRTYIIIILSVLYSIYVLRIVWVVYFLCENPHTHNTQYISIGCLRKFRYRFHKHAHFSHHHQIDAILLPSLFSAQDKKIAENECGCFWRECVNIFCKQSYKFRRPVTFQVPTRQP